MLNSAKAKLQAEIDKNTNKPHIQIIGQFLLKYLESNPAAAEKIAQQDKTIIKSFDEMRNAAAKKKDGNVAMLTDQEAFTIVLKYFGIEDAGIPLQEVDIKPHPVPEKKTADFDIRLEDLL